MTANRASLLGLFGLLLFLGAAAVSCNLATSPYGETDEVVCTTQAHCDDLNVCTKDACGPDGVCTHEAEADGLFPDGVQGNCKVLQCQAGVRSDAAAPEDVDDGNPCTKDECDGPDAKHTIEAGTPCQIQGGMSTCNAAGECEVPECGHIGPDDEEVGCGANPSECTIAYCDKGKGKCMLEALDGVPVPGSAPPEECGGKYCLAGDVLDKTAPVGSPCALFGGDPGKCDADGACVQCIAKADCDDGIVESKCHSFECVMGACVVMTAADGPLVGTPVGDCHVEVCSAGLYEDQIDNTDVNVDGNECTQDLCVNGVPSNPPTVLNTPCGEGGLLYCNGLGVCKGCTSDSQCLGATDCKTPFCDIPNDQCSFTYAPLGGNVTAQIAGDCAKVVCDGNGNTTEQYEANDPENDANDCTMDFCTAMDATTHMVLAKGTACSNGGGVVCDAVAHCVGAPCPANACPMGTTCVDGVCCESSCGGTCNACSATKKGAGPNGLCGPIMVGDPDTTDCPGNSGCQAGACQPLAQGAACVGVAGECATGFCTDGFCCGSACGATCQACNVVGMAGTCANVPNLSDPANECANGACNGAGACKLDNGQPCGGMGGNCLSGNCVDGVCCNTTCGATCQACNVAGSVGTCSNVPNNTDPASECANGACNGGGQCKLDNGQPCGSSGDCLTNNCPAADGVCCNTACSGTCQACSGAKTGGANGTCGNVTNLTDPDNECLLTTSCNGSGACNKLPNGSACTQNGECNSNVCNGDGVCCNNACGGTCQACNLAGSMGTCTSIPLGSDPGNECASGACNGAGACELDNGQSCTTNGQCLSNFCVDNRCCNTTCSGTCESCNQAGLQGTCTFIPDGTDPGNDCANGACNGAGACELDDGQSCTTNGQCASGFCVDNRCCNVLCSGTCQGCSNAKTGVANGTCAGIPAGADPDSECAGALVCDGGNPGACKKPNGATCSMNGADATCLSGFCADGVCCDGACNGACEACSAAGVCTDHAVNTDPENDCAGAQVCSMLGTCVDGPNGTLCAVDGTDNNCASDICKDGRCCGTTCAGPCEACNLGTPGTCQFIAVNTDPAAECTGAQICNGSGACADAPNGLPCPADGPDNDCVSNHCADGVCCGTTCGGLCEACDLGGSVGTCTFIPAGTDPDMECDDVMMPNCGGAGTCVP